MSALFHVLARGSRVCWRGEIWVLHRISRSEVIFRESTCGIELRLGRRRLIDELRMNKLQLLEPQYTGSCGGSLQMGAHVTAEAAIVVRVSPPWGHSADSRWLRSSSSVTPQIQDLEHGQRTIAHRSKRVIDRRPASIDQWPPN